MTEKKLPKADVKVKPEVKGKEHHKSYFPRLFMMFGIFLIIISAMSYLSYFKIQKMLMELIMLVAGLWVLKVGLDKGFYKKRKELLKKYI